MLDILAATLLGVAMPATCDLPFPVAKDEAAARAIAQAVIASAPGGPGEFAPYTLKLNFVEERQSWRAFQSPEPRNGVQFLGGGGLGMEIAACNGAVSDVHRQR